MFLAKLLQKKHIQESCMMYRNKQLSALYYVFWIENSFITINFYPAWKLSFFLQNITSTTTTFAIRNLLLPFHSVSYLVLIKQFLKEFEGQNSFL